MANTYLAVDSGLELIPAMNKIDLPGAEPERVAGEIGELLGEDPDSVIRISAKTGEGVTELLNRALVERVPPPRGRPRPCRALIFDSEFDQYRGVVMRARRRRHPEEGRRDPRDAGRRSPRSTRSAARSMMPVEQLRAGEVGYVITGIKDVSQLRVGDTLTTRSGAAAEPLPGYREIKPMVFCGLFPVETNQFPDLRDALEKLSLNDAALTWEPRRARRSASASAAGSSGCSTWTSCESGSSASTTSSCSRRRRTWYDVHLTDGGKVVVHSPADMPDRANIASIEEPYIQRDDPVPEGVRQRRDGALPDAAERTSTPAYLSQERVSSTTTCRSRRSSMLDLRPAEVAYEGLRLARLRGTRHAQGIARELDILLAGDKVDFASMVVHRDKAYHMVAGSPSGCCKQIAPAVRGRDPGGDRVADHRPRVRQAGAQGRDRQVLRRRHHPQAQAPREAEGGRSA